MNLEALSQTTITLLYLNNQCIYLLCRVGEFDFSTFMLTENTHFPLAVLKLADN